MQIETTRIDTDGNNFRIAVIPSNDIQVGSFKTDAIVQPIARHSGALPKVKLTVTGVVLPDLAQLIPARVLLGAREIGERVTETIIVRPLGRKELTIDRVSSNSNDLTVNSLGKDEEGNHVFQLKVEITKERNHQIDVVFFVEGEGKNRPSSISLPVSYFGVANGRDKE